MTPNDKQIDLLMRRYARAADNPTVGDHLDADEMNTFAQGALPPAARAQYVSHLASCVHCRQQVAQLALASGAIARAETSVVENPKHQTVWQSVGAFLSPRVLRYAGFAAVLLIAVGITFIALRRAPRPDDLVASRSEAEQHPATATQPPAGSSNEAATEANTNARPQQYSSPARGAEESVKRDADKLAEAAPAPLLAKEAPAPTVEAKKPATESVTVTSEPSYASAPPAGAGQGTSVGGVAAKRDSLKTGEDRAASTERERSQGFLMGSRDDRQSKDQPATQQRRVADEKTKGGPSRNLDNTAMRNANENRTESIPLKISAPKPNAAEETPTRSAGGRKFRKQGSAWVDQKFKSSMTLKSVARGSEEFNSLDSGLRSIAQQLGGEIIVVWKGKAYLIK
jgi:hypothetical protein